MLDLIDTDWMTIAAIAAAAIALMAVVSILERARLNRYWKKACVGVEWKRRFPSVPRERIRSFLTLFVKSFGFSKKQQPQFSPNDRIIDIYRAVYLLKEKPDATEIEAFIKSIRQKYRINLTPHWHENITLGEVFEHTMFTHSLHTIIAHA